MRGENHEGLPPTKRPPPTPKVKEEVWHPFPVPSAAPLPPTAHYKLGESIACWTYHSATGAVLAHVLRFQLRDEHGNQLFDADGKPKKTDRPLTWGRMGNNSLCGWSWRGWPAPRPLYNLHLLAAHPDRPVIICKGEKAATAATTILPDWIATCSMNGAQSPDKTDWGPLRGRDILIWLDADEPGEAYAAAVAKRAMEAGAASVEVMEFTL